jgi:hypothetical protein
MQAGSIAQVAECLFSKRKTLIQTPITPKQTKRIHIFFVVGEDMVTFPLLPSTSFCFGLVSFKSLNQ